MRISRRLLLAAGAPLGALTQFNPTDLGRVAAGVPAPDFTLPTGDGRTLTLSQFRGRNVVLVFYRGHW